jgi:4-amino-4-deoxy-L-arabinose transferase-like glycosyltransferase
MGKGVLLALCLLFLIGFYLRTLYLPQNAITFGYDQARDAFIAQQILNGDFKIVGPPTSTNITYHGVLYYYIIAPAYSIGHGSPIIAAYWLAFLSSFAIPVVYFLTLAITKSIRTGLIAACLFTVSFEASQFATWLSNPALAVITIPLLYLGLWKWTQDKAWWGPYLTGFALGLSIQAEIFLLYQIFPVGIWLLSSNKALNRKTIIAAGSMFALATSSMILAEIKFGFKSFGGFAEMFSAKQGLWFQDSLGTILINYLNHLGRGFAYSIYPGNIGYGGMFILILIIITLFSWNRPSLRSVKDRNNKDGLWKPFLTLWLLSPFLIVTLGGGNNTGHLMVGLSAAVVTLTAIYINKWWNKNIWLALGVIVLIVFANFQAIKRENKNGQTIFAIQHDMLLSKQLAAVDYTYSESAGRPFSTNTLTSPLWINLVWTYLYQWKGSTQYGYTPEWHGHNQIGQIADLSATRPDTTRYYLIIEPMDGIPAQYLPLTIGEEDSVSKLEDEKSFGAIRVQKRTKI